MWMESVTTTIWYKWWAVYLGNSNSLKQRGLHVVSMNGKLWINASVQSLVVSRVAVGELNSLHPTLFIAFFLFLISVFDSFRGGLLKLGNPKFKPKFVLHKVIQCLICLFYFDFSQTCWFHYVIRFLRNWVRPDLELPIWLQRSIFVLGSANPMKYIIIFYRWQPFSL